MWLIPVDLSGPVLIVDFRPRYPESGRGRVKTIVIGCRDTRQNNNQHNGTQHTNTQHNGTQHINTQFNDTEHNIHTQHKN